MTFFYIAEVQENARSPMLQGISSGKNAQIPDLDLATPQWKNITSQSPAMKLRKNVFATVLESFQIS